MIYSAIDIWNSPSLEHHGVKGMKWGVRKVYHNFQGRRYRRAAASVQRDIDSLRSGSKTGMSKSDTAKSISALNKVKSKNLAKAKQHESYKPKGLSTKQKVAIGVGAGVAVAAGAAYLATRPGFKTSMKTVVQVRPKEGSTFANILKKSRPAMKTPVANIKAGPSIMRDTIQRKEAGLIRKSYNKESINWGQAQALAAQRHASSPAARAKAYNNLHYLGYNSYGMKGKYSPRYTTNKGGQVGAKLKKSIVTGKPYKFDRNLYRF